jgi:hypothetical protein
MPRVHACFGSHDNGNRHPGYRWVFLAVRQEFSRRYLPYHAVCTRATKDNLQIPRGLREIVLQICILGFVRPSVGAILPQPAPPAVEHRRPFAWWHISRANPLRRNGKGVAWCALSRSKKVAQRRGNGIADFLPSYQEILTSNCDGSCSLLRIRWNCSTLVEEPVRLAADAMAYDHVQKVHYVHNRSSSFLATSQNVVLALHPGRYYPTCPIHICIA